MRVCEWTNQVAGGGWCVGGGRPGNYLQVTGCGAVYSDIMLGNKLAGWVEHTLPQHCTQVAGLFCHFLLWNRSFSGILASKICCEAIIACSLTKPITRVPQEPTVPWLQTQTRQRAAIPAREFTMPQGPGSATRTPLLKRAVILALNWHAGFSFDAIAVKVNVNSWTARRIVERTKV